MNNLRILFTLLLFAFEAYTKPAISVIVPVYKTERFLQECLDSILNQSMKDIEVICINDASPDDCAKILAEYAKKDSRIVVINFSQNRGPSAARNAGLDSAQGDYIAFCDSDDYMHPDMLQILYREIKKEDFDIAYCHTNHVGESTIQHFEKIPSYVIEKYTTIQEPDKQTISNNYFSVLWCKLYKKTTIGSSKFDEELFCFEDISFNLSLLGSLKKYVLVPAKLYYWRRARQSRVCSSLHF
ncbi:MAG: glycosyltransferase, partial [Holosporaceae bacterium]|nr:glycosyltransferase [Holosporaceae bacterium]